MTNMDELLLQKPAGSIAQLVMAGARAIGLATQAQLYATLERRSPEAADALSELAARVLEDWGVKSASHAPETPAPTPASAALDEPELSWPPPPPVLPAGYGDCYYHVREACIGAIRDGRDESFDLTPDMALVFAGASEWDIERQCWLLRLGIPRAGELIAPGTLPSLGQLRKFWVHSRNLKPGDEIPKGEPLP